MNDLCFVICSDFSVLIGFWPHPVGDVGKKIETFANQVSIFYQGSLQNWSKVFYMCN